MKKNRFKWLCQRKKNPFLNGKAGRGLSFIEVLMTVIILSITMLTLMQAVSQGLRMLENSEQVALAARLARQKMAEMEMKNFVIGGETSGIFKQHKDIAWKVEVKDPDIPEAKDFSISQINLTVEWGSALNKQKIEISTYSAKIDKIK